MFRDVAVMVPFSFAGPIARAQAPTLIAEELAFCSDVYVVSLVTLTVTFPAELDGPLSPRVIS